MPYYKTIGEFLTDVQIALNNPQTNTEIQESLATFGYTSDRIQEG